MPALCHFYPGLTPPVIDQMSMREVITFLIFMNKHQTGQVGGDVLPFEVVPE